MDDSADLNEKTEHFTNEIKECSTKNCYLSYYTTTCKEEHSALCEVIASLAELRRLDSKDTDGFQGYGPIPIILDKTRSEKKEKKTQHSGRWHPHVSQPTEDGTVCPSFNIYILHSMFK